MKKYDGELTIFAEGVVDRTVLKDREKVAALETALNTAGFEIVQTTWPAARIQQPMLDELAKRLVGQPHTFV